MDRVVAMLILLGILVSITLSILAFFAIAPVFCSCIISLLYTLYLFISNEASTLHHAQEFENRFWTIFAVLFSTAVFFANDSPIAIGQWSPSIGFLGVLTAGYGMHAYDRHVHRMEISRGHSLTRGNSAAKSLHNLQAMGIPVDAQLMQINSCLNDIDQLLIPSTINNIINQNFILRKEREIISIFNETPTKALNYIVQHCKLGLLFYKVKDHRHYGGQHRTELIELLAVTRISELNILSRVFVLHALQMLKLPANSRSEHWVKNIFTNTHQDDLSELKCLTDAKGDYFCMTKLLYRDIRSPSVRRDVLSHFSRESRVQEAHMTMKTKKSKLRSLKAWRKVLSDVDDTLYSSGGSYPAGVDKRYAKKVIYPGVLSFYRELDVGVNGPEEFPPQGVGNLVFLSARPHVYKDVSEKHNFEKFKKMRKRGMHATPSLLAGDMASGRDFVVRDDMEPLAKKKFQNFKEYVSIYPEFKHVFVGDNGQGDLRAGELMFNSFPKHLEMLYIHKVQTLQKTHGYDQRRYYETGFSNRICFFETYPDAALHAARHGLIKISGLRRIGLESVRDFAVIQQANQWKSEEQKRKRREELNLALDRCNRFLKEKGEYDEIQFVMADRVWENGDRVRTIYGIAIVIGFDPVWDMYNVLIDWRSLDVQVEEYKTKLVTQQQISFKGLETVVETPGDELETEDSNNDDKTSKATLKATLKAPGENSNDENPNTGHEESLQKDFDAEAVAAATDAAFIPALTKGQALAVDDNKKDTSTKTSIAGNNNSPPATVNVNTTSNPENLSPITTTPPSSSSPPLTSITTGGAATNTNTHFVTATLHRSSLLPFTPPKLPNIPSKNPRSSPSLFSFFSSPSTNSAHKQQQQQQQAASTTTTMLFKVNDKCSTPYGDGIVLEYRPKQHIVVLSFIGWNGKAYLNETCVKSTDSKGLFQRLIRRMNSDTTGDDNRGGGSSSGGSNGNKNGKGSGEGGGGGSSSSSSLDTKLDDFWYNKGGKIQTPFGEGVISRPLPKPSSSTAHNTDSIHNIGNIDNNEPEQQQQQQSPSAASPSTTTSNTIAIHLTSWILANSNNNNKSHPVLYCTLTTAKSWKESNPVKKTDAIGFLGGVLTSIVTRVYSKPTTTQQQQQQPSPSNENNNNNSTIITTTSTTTTQKNTTHSQYFQNGATITTLYGHGIVQSHRPSDGFYIISFPFATAYLHHDVISHYTSPGTSEGGPVLISIGGSNKGDGISGILAGVEPTTSIHIVTIPSVRMMVCYLHPMSVLRPLKACVGEEVLTPYGEGLVRLYRTEDDVYGIELVWGGWMYAHGETFDRVVSSDYCNGVMMNGRQRGRGEEGGMARGEAGRMGWLLKYLFFANSGAREGEVEERQEEERSRSNSIVSLSAKSVSTFE